MKIWTKLPREERQTANRPRRRQMMTTTAEPAARLSTARSPTVTRTSAGAAGPLPRLGPRSRAATAAALGDGLVASHEPPPALPGEPSGQVPRGYRGAGNCVPTKSCTSNSHLTHSCQSLDATRRPSGGSNPGPSRLGTRVGAKENRAIRSRAARGSPGRALPGEGSRANRLQTV